MEPPSVISGTAFCDSAINEWTETAIVVWKASSGQSSTGACSASIGAKAIA
jgi:hypothetical protein